MAGFDQHHAMDSDLDLLHVGDAAHGRQDRDFEAHPAQFVGSDLVKRGLRAGLHRLGYEITRQESRQETLGYDDEAAARALIARVADSTMVPIRRLITLYQQVRYCEEAAIPGSFVECGVWKGGSVGLMALANLQHGRQRRPLHLFDAFQDICEPDAKVDGSRALDDVRRFAPGGGTGGTLQPLTGFYDQFGGPGTLDGNRELLERRIGYDPAMIHYHVGWFQDTVPRDAAACGEIALLRLDGDWHASTKICLEHLYERVVPRGVVIIDDYGTYEGCRKAVDDYLSMKGIKVLLNHVDADCRYWIKPG